MNDWRHGGDRHKFRQRMETDRNYVIFLNLQRGDIYYYIKTVQLLINGTILANRVCM